MKPMTIVFRSHPQQMDASETPRSPQSILAIFVALIVSLALLAQPLTAQHSKQDFLAANIDRTVSPRDDFFQYANGEWLKRNPIPPDQSSWGRSNVISEDLYARLRRVSEEAAAKKAPRGSSEQLIGDLWFTAMDAATLNKHGLAPLRPDLV